MEESIDTLLFFNNQSLTAISQSARTSTYVISGRPPSSKNKIINGRVIKKSSKKKALWLDKMTKAELIQLLQIQADDADNVDMKKD